MERGGIKLKIIIGGKEIKLVDRDVRTAKRLCRKFLKTAKSMAEERHAHTFYLTLLIVMYLIAHDYISAATPETVALLLNAAYKNEENRSS